MNKTQLKKLIKVLIISTLIILISETVFSIPVINNFFSNLLTTSNGVWTYIILWIIMFLQVTILNIPAYVILSASVSIGLNVLGWQYLLTVMTAYMSGCILAYWLGRWFGVKAVKWIAGSEDDFNKWCNVLNTKGKMWYFLTILFPFFPDDLLCIVAGSVKFRFDLYTIFNFIGRGIGLICMLLTLLLLGSIGGGFPYMIIVWGIALIVEVIIYARIKDVQES